LKRGFPGRAAIPAVDGVKSAKTDIQEGRAMRHPGFAQISCPLTPGRLASGKRIAA